jgi:2'-5' RNA ligase
LRVSAASLSIESGRGLGATVAGTGGWPFLTSSATNFSMSVKNSWNVFIMPPIYIVSMFLFKEWLLTEEAHKFSCVLAALPKIKSHIAMWLSKNVSKKDLYLPEDSKKDDVHVTVLYGLHTEDFEDVVPILKKFKPFSIKLGKVSKFSAEKYDVLKVEVISSVLRDMNAALKKLPYTSKFPKYIAHCTIAYVKPGTCDDLLGDKEFEGISIKISDVDFSNPAGKKTNIKIT